MSPQEGGANIAALLRKKADDYLTNYLRSTTTDQEILDFYGEGNIIGRKGIPATDKELLDVVTAAEKLRSSPLRPTTDRPNFAVGGIDQEIGYKYTTEDMPNVINPSTGRPWQMTFGALPKDFGVSSLTPAAQQYLVDFRVPRNAGSDYSFATGPNIQDRIEFETKQLLENDPYFGRQPEKLAEKLKEIKNKSAYIGEFGGQPQTPVTWKERGYITEKPSNLKENVINKFSRKIFETQGPFGGVSTLTPVEQLSAANPQWRAELYQREGLAGPLSSQSFRSGYGGGSKDVQRFTTGSERLLPLQPYTEFFERVGDPTAPSVLNTKPAPDFTPFQKAIGTRNYLIGRNILEGRGTLGAGFRSGLRVGAADFIPSRDVVKDIYAGKGGEAALRMAGDIASGVPVGLATAAAVSSAPILAPVATGVGIGLVSVRAAEALDEAVRQQTGEGIVSKARQFIGTAPRTGVADPAPAATKPLVASVKPLTAEQKQEMQRRAARSELEKRVDLLKERFNPAKNEFGLSELLFGR